MRALIQRVTSARVSIDGDIVGSINSGILVLIGLHRDDTLADGEWLIKKLLAVRLFEDEAGKMGRSVEDIRGELLVVSQFTLYGELNKGTRPDFGAAMPSALAKPFFEEWMKQLRAATQLTIAEGRFGAHMKIDLANDGPVTLMIDSKK
ncbi:MAG: D-aminoacyl-tRNA deacylase [Planctomycetota bacterium]